MLNESPEVKEAAERLLSDDPQYHDDVYGRMAKRKDYRAVARAYLALRTGGAGVPSDDGKREQEIQRRNAYVRRMNQMLETILDDGDSLEWIVANDPTVLEKLRRLLDGPAAKGEK